MSSACVARMSLDNVIYRSWRRQLLQLRITCNNAREGIAPSYDPAFACGKSERDAGGAKRGVW
jgi:hypothetical protein